MVRVAPSEGLPEQEDRHTAPAGIAGPELCHIWTQNVPDKPEIPK